MKGRHIGKESHPKRIFAFHRKSKERRNTNAVMRRGKRGSDTIITDIIITARSIMRGQNAVKVLCKDHIKV